VLEVAPRRAFTAAESAEPEACATLAAAGPAAAAARHAGPGAVPLLSPSSVRFPEGWAVGAAGAAGDGAVGLVLRALPSLCFAVAVRRAD
jgi:hypothetical protein